MPTYKRAHLIGRAIRSVLAQGFRRFELIVVDDCSPDDTGQVVRAFGDPRVRYVRRDRNGGVSLARNTAIEAAAPSPYLAFLDDDDEWFPDKLELQLELFERGGPDLGIVGCGRIDVDPAGTEVFVPRHRGRIFADLLARRAKGYGTNLTLVRRSSPEVLFDESLPALEDMDYILRMARDCSVDFVPKPLVKIHRDHGGPHVWNNANSLAGHLGILKKYEAEILARPPVEGHYCFCIGRELAHLGRGEESRGWLSRAAARDPRNRWRLLLWRAAARIGGPALRLCESLALVPPPESDEMDALPRPTRP